MFICDALDSLHLNGIEVNLLTGYKPATIVEKAETPLYFKPSEQYYKMPAYQITTAGNLNATFAMNGTCVDTAHDTEMDAVSFKSVSFVKNGKLFKDRLYINSADTAKVSDLGITVVDDYIPMDQFALVKDIDVPTAGDIAYLSVHEWVRKCLAGKAPKKAPVELSETEQWLKENGFYNGVYAAPIKKATNVVANDGTIVSIKIAKCSGKIDLAKLDEKVAANKKLTFSEAAINKCRELVLEDRSGELCEKVYNVVSAHASIDEEVVIDFNGIEFTVTVTIK